MCEFANRSLVFQLLFFKWMKSQLTISESNEKQGQKANKLTGVCLCVNLTIAHTVCASSL